MSAVALPHDERLPQLATALDGATMAGVFDDVVRAHDVTVERCDIERVKYRPASHCRVAYRLHLRHRAGGPAFEQRVAARVGADSDRRATRAALRPLTPSAGGPALRLLPALQMLTWWWPNDAKLRAPAWLADAARRRAELLPGVLGALGGGRLIDHAVDVVQYVPEQRLTARVALQWHDGRAVRTQRVYAKASREPDGAAAHGLLAQLQASAAWREGRLCTPAALLWQPAAGLHWQTEAPGRAWLDLPAAQADVLMPALGRQLAALHATPVATARAVTLAAMQARLIEVVATVGAALPASQRDLRRAAAALTRGLRHVEGAAPASLHGDLHPRNLLVDGDRLSIIDLDGLRRGPALLEIGSWIADGAYRALLAGTPPDAPHDGWRALLEAYAAAGGARFDAGALAWATAWGLLTQRAFRCVVNLKPGRFAIAPRLVTLAGAIAEGRMLDL